MNKAAAFFACIACLLLGYIAGREHSRREQQIEIEAAFEPLKAIAAANMERAEQVAKQNACINNLRQIDGAKEQWALENRISAGASVESEQIAPFILRGMPSCPGEGTYSLHSIGENPTCSAPGHRLSF